jgi:hypothetical protein
VFVCLFFQNSSKALLKEKERLGSAKEKAVA